MTFWFLHPWIWDRSVSASMSMVATMDGKAGRKTAARLLKKLCQRLGRQNIDFFNGTCLPTTYCSALREYDIRFFIHGYGMGCFSLHVRGGSNHGWEGRVGKRTCWLVCCWAIADGWAREAPCQRFVNPTTRSILEQARQHQPQAPIVPPRLQ